MDTLTLYCKYTHSRHYIWLLPIKACNEFYMMDTCKSEKALCSGKVWQSSRLLVFPSRYLATVISKITQLLVSEIYDYKLLTNPAYFKRYLKMNKIFVMEIRKRINKIRTDCFIFEAYI